MKRGGSSEGREEREEKKREGREGRGGSDESQRDEKMRGEKEDRNVLVMKDFFLFC